MMYSVYIMSDKTLIFYLTACDRYFIFDKFIDEINKCSVDTIDKLHLLIVNSSPDMTYYESKLTKQKIQYTCVHVPCPQNNYLPKVKYAINFGLTNNFKYTFKCDNDFIITHYTMDYIIQNISLLDSKYLTLSPNISTGMPSVEYFIDEAFTKDESEQIRDEFKKCKFNLQPGVFDYRGLHQPGGKWDYKQFFNQLTNLPTWYKGAHPVRYGFGNDMINDLIIKHKTDIFQKKDCSVIEGDISYFANMGFFINTQIYHKLINVEKLTINGCDDIPLNRYGWKHNLKHGIISHGYAIHIAYGWRWCLNNTQSGHQYVDIDCPTKTLIEYEEQFINKLYVTDSI
jgi:hypothetical protein